MHVQSCCFANLNLLFFSRSRCRRRRRCSKNDGDPKNFTFHGNMTSHFSDTWLLEWQNATQIIASLTALHSHLLTMKQECQLGFFYSYDFTLILFIIKSDSNRTGWRNKRFRTDFWVQNSTPFPDFFENNNYFFQT